MSLPPPPSLFTTIERRCADTEPTPPLRLHDDTPEGPAGTALTLAAARELLYDRSFRPGARADLWHQIAERLRSATPGSRWPEAVAWLALPGLRRTAYKITWRFRAERADVESELITCYLEALAALRADDPDPGAAVVRTACSRAFEVWRGPRAEHAVDDIARTAATTSTGTERAGHWQADYDPVPHGTGLSATVRVTVPADRVEGVRLGALARSWGVADTATSVGFSGRGRQVATLALRRVRRDG